MIRSAASKVVCVGRATVFYAVVLAMILALMVVVMVSAGTKPAEAAFPGQNGRLAFVGEGGHIYTIRANGTDLQKLTNSPKLSTQPAWSPNGKKIAFARGGGGSDFEIHTMKADGTGKKKITNNTRDDLEPAWSPNGKRLVFRRGPVNGPDDIFTMRASDGKGVKRVTNNDHNTYGPDWSSNGDKIAHLGYDENDDEQVYTIAPDGSGQQQLTNDPCCVKTSLTWSPDGTKIAYDAQLLRVMDEDGSNNQQLNPNPFIPFAREPTWSPDGKKIAFLGTFPGKIHTMNASDGSGAQKISDHPAGDLAWQPNTAPVIENLAPSPGSESLDKTPTIGATVRDRQTNLAKADISLFLDGQNLPKAEFSYNRKTDRLSFTPDTNLSLGYHTAKIVARDDALLTKSRTWQFQVKGSVIGTGAP